MSNHLTGNKTRLWPFVLLVGLGLLLAAGTTLALVWNQEEIPAVEVLR